LADPCLRVGITDADFIFGIEIQQKFHHEILMLLHVRALVIQLT